MRSFTEVDDSGGNKDNIIIELTTKEAKIILTAMGDYCERNKRKTTAKKLFKEIEEKFEVY